MRKLILEQEILKLPNDTKWEYAVINGVWNARKVGSTNWINIETNPKVKNPTAVNLLNKTFPTAKSKSQSLSGQTKTNQLNKMSQGILKPLDVNKSIKLFFGNNNSITLFPNVKDLSSNIIKFLNVDTSKSGNVVKLPNSKGFYCDKDRSYYIFSNGSDYDTAVCGGGLDFNPNYMAKQGIFRIKQNYNIPTFEYGTYSEYSKSLGENSLRFTIKKILKEEIQNKK